MREQWTDERLDDLNRKVNDGFADTRSAFRGLRGEMKTEFREIRGEIKDEFRDVKDEFREVKDEFREVRGEIRSQTRLFIGLYGALIVALLAPHL